MFKKIGALALAGLLYATGVGLDVAGAQGLFSFQLSGQTVVGNPRVLPGPGAAIPFSILTGSLLSNITGAISCGSTGFCTLPMAANSIKCNNTGVTAPAIDCTGLQAEQLLQFLQSGTGAVQRSVDSWMKAEWVHSSDFMAAGSANTNTATPNITITSGTNALAVNVPTFVSSDCQTGGGCTGTLGNKAIAVAGIGPAGGVLTTSIVGFTDTQHITLGTNASTSQAATVQQIVWGTDVTVQLQNWLNQCTLPTSWCVLDPGRYMLTNALGSSVNTGITIVGAGKQSEIIQGNNTQSIFNFTTTINFAPGPMLYTFRLSQYFPMATSTGLINLTGSATQQFNSTLVDLYLFGGNTAIAASNVQYLNIDRNVWIGQSVQGLFYDYPLTCATGLFKIANSFIAPISGGNGVSVGAAGGVTIQNNDISTQGNRTGTGILLNSSTACNGGDVFVDGNNIENWATGISFLKGSETTGGSNHVSGNDFFNNSASLSLGDGNANWLLDVSVTANQFYCITTCVTVTNSVQNATLTGNTFTALSGTPTGLNVSGNAVAGVAEGNIFSGLTTNVLNSSPKFLAESVANGHTKFVGVAPTISVTTCPSAAIAAGSTDQDGLATFTNTATSCNVTFAQSYAVAPFCTSSTNPGSSLGMSSSAGGFNVSFAAGPTQFMWHCRGN